MLKIAVIGPESTGKSTLAGQLAQHFSGDFVPEYSRAYFADRDYHYDIDDVIAIAQGQQSAIDAAAAKHPNYLICDTEAIVNKVWCEYVYGTTSDAIEKLVQTQHFDLYLLCDIDLEWTYDPLRQNPDPNERKAIFALYLDALKAINANFCIISGEGEVRMKKSISAIESMEKKQRHIIFLARWYPHRYDPMFGLFVQRHAEAAALYNKVSVVYVHADTAAKQKYEMERTMEHGVDTIRVYYKKEGKLSSPIRFWKACQKALKVVGPADLFHVHVLTRLGVVALWEKLRHGTPYMITEHWSRYLPGNDFSGILRKNLTRIVVKNAAMVTTVTRNLAQAMQNHGLKNAHYVVLPNVVDTQLFRPQPHENPVPILIHISCFEDKSKNISGLLQALKTLKDEGTSYKAILIGDGMDFKAMRQLADDFHLQDRVQFTGLLEGQALVDVLASGDFLVLSSNYENMPVVILEALACGLPVVSTKVGGIAEIINESNGILVPPRDTNALKEAIQKMCANHKNYDADTLRERIVKNYGNEEVGKLLSAWYDEILSANR